MKRINEEFKSAKLRKLTTFFPPKISWSSIAQAFKIEVDQITDDQVQVVSGPQAYKLLKNNQNLMGFFIFTNDRANDSRGLMGIKLGSKFVRLSNSTSPLQPTYHGDPTNPKYIRKGTKKNAYLDTDTGIRNTTGKANKYQQSMFSGSNRYGKDESGWFTAGDFFREDVIVYVLDTTMSASAPAEKFTSRPKNRMLTDTMDDIRRGNQSRYKSELAKLRELKDPEFVKELKTILDDLSKTVNDTTNFVMQNASKFKYSSIDDYRYFGTGKNRSSSTTSLLKLFVQAYSSFDDIVKNYKSGSLDYSNFEKIKNSYEYRQLMSYKSSIEKVSTELKRKLDS